MWTEKKYFKKKLTPQSDDGGAECMLVEMKKKHKRVQ